MAAFDLPCTNWPTEKQKRKAKRFGEGFTWTCHGCSTRLVLVQGKGNYWYWKTDFPRYIKQQSATNI